MSRISLDREDHFKHQVQCVLYILLWIRRVKIRFSQVLKHCIFAPSQPHLTVPHTDKKEALHRFQHIYKGKILRAEANDTFHFII